MVSRVALRSRGTLHQMHPLLADDALALAHAINGSLGLLAGPSGL